MKNGLSERTLNTLHEIIKRYSGIQKVILYGSRAKGNYKTGSDIDLTLITDENFTRSNLLSMSNDFDDSDIPYKVDLSIYNELSNQNLKEHIDRCGIEL